MCVLKVDHFSSFLSLFILKRYVKYSMLIIFCLLFVFMFLCLFLSAFDISDVSIIKELVKSLSLRHLLEDFCIKMPNIIKTEIHCKNK